MSTTLPRLSFWTRLLDVVSPRLCAVCGRRLTVSEQSVCGQCLLHLPLTGFERNPADNVVARLFWGQLPLERAVSMFYYEPQSEVAQLIYHLKYHDHPEVGYDLGALFARQLQPTGFFDGIDALVPVPLTRRRQWQRGYNQSAEIARGVSSVTGIAVNRSLVRRTVFHRSQTRLNVWERRTNVDDVFHLTNADSLRGRHLLLIDDVVTTGATLTSCGRALAALGGVRLSVLTLGFAK